MIAYSNVTWTKEKHIDSFMEGFSNSLSRLGNNVLVFRMNELTSDFFENTPNPRIDLTDIKRNISAFNPDLIITFNNMLPDPDLLAYTDCPICIYSADVPITYSSQTLIKENLDRYYFLNGARYIEKSVRKIYKAKDHQMYLFGHATDMHALKIKKERDIMYVGSLPSHSEIIVNYFLQLDSGNSDSSVKNQIKKEFFEALERIELSEFTEDFDFDLGDVGGGG